MDFSQLNEMYIVTKYICRECKTSIAGLFRGRENAERYIEEHESSDAVYHFDKVVTDF